MKQCTKCRKKLPKTSFHKKRAECKLCIKVQHKKYVLENPEKRKQAHDNWYKRSKKHKSEYYQKNHIKTKAKIYDISVEELTNLFNKSNGICAICNKKSNLSVDHDHKTGKVRGLLCPRCNFGIGNLGDDITILKSAIEYLKGF
jgi:hypothetical protein